MDTGNTDEPPTLSPVSGAAVSEVKHTTSEPRESLKLTLSLSSIKKEEVIDSSSKGENTPPLSTTTVGKTALSNLLQSKSVVSVQGQLTKGGVSSDQISLLADRQTSVVPSSWTVLDVCYFLKSQDCAQHCESFAKMVRIVS